MATGSAIESEDHWDLPLVGEVVTQCVVDNAFGLAFGSRPPTHSLRVYVPFELSTGGERTTLTAERPSELGAALALFRKTVISSRSSKRGALHVVFAMKPRCTSSQTTTTKPGTQWLYRRAGRLCARRRSRHLERAECVNKTSSTCC